MFIDGQVFNNIFHNNKHLLGPLLPPERNQQYYLHHRRHNFQIPIHNFAFNDKNYNTVYHGLTTWSTYLA